MIHTVAYGCARPDIPLHRAAGLPGTASAALLPPLNALTRANSASEKAGLKYEIALVHLRFEPDTEAIAR
jgi:hypothetical protein